MSDRDKNGSALPLFWADKFFWLALLLAPVCWAGMLWLGLTNSYSAGVAWSSLLWIGLIYPVLEEIVFRGGLQMSLWRHRFFKKELTGISLANVCTSVIFAAFHLINYSPVWALLVFFPSLVFGWARDRYQHIKASIALHITYNAGFVLLFGA